MFPGTQAATSVHARSDYARCATEVAVSNLDPSAVVIP